MYLTLMNCTLKMVKIANFVLYVFYHSLEKNCFERQDILFPVFEEILGAIRYFRSLSWLTAYSWLSTTCVWIC